MPCVGAARSSPRGGGPSAARRGGARLVAALLVAAGCGRIEGTHDRAPRKGTGRLVAGAASVEIAPVPGYPMGGHALESRVGLGTWTPLFARALYVEDASGEPLVMVVVDLWAVSAGLADEVAERLREDADLVHVGRENLLLSATHTHHGPGNFASNRVYNQHASNLPGFDPILFDYVADRIVEAVTAAAATAEPARIVKHSGRLGGIARNRSFEAFARNPEAAGLLDENAMLPPCREEAPGPPEACRAVDPTARVLVVESTERKVPLAVVAQFSMHPTAMPNHTEIYHGDVFGMAADRLERRWRKDQPAVSPTVLLVNGPEGDVSPNWTVQGPGETRRLAEELADGLADVVEGPEEGEVTGPFVPHHTVVRLAGRVVETDAGILRTARRPLAGRSQVVGAEDGPTVFRNLGWHEGMALPEGHEAMPGHGRKLPVVWAPLTQVALPPGAVPETVPLTLVEAAGMTFATLPGEFTTILGRRIRREVQRRTGTPALLLGLGGEYLGYFTTPEAYDAQHYEGASMMYGRDAGHVVLHDVVARLDEARGRAERPHGRFSYAPGRIRRFGLHVDRVARRLLDGVEDRARTQLEAPDLPSATFTVIPPAWPAVPDAGRALPRIELVDDAGRVVDAPHDAHACVVTQAAEDGWSYTCFLVDAAYEGYRLRLRTPEAGERCSTPIRAGQAVRTGPC
ncbi:MAG: hypothetical protein D6705_06470 [Deltaproteobacteria bacterium]|nr:MAG: hypothetical protein D6705_06470 [Deltaproteobacteria bacterium]